MVINNFIEARKARRKIIELLTKQQVNDSCCAERLKQVGLDAKRRLFESLASWLVSFEPGKQLSEHDQSILSAMQLSPEDWLSAQSVEAELCGKLATARRREREAHELYKKVAPYGFIQVALKKGGEKTKARQFQEGYESEKTSREEIEHRLISARECIRMMIGAFLGKAIKAESLEVLLGRESSIKEELSGLIQRSRDKAIEVWARHSEQQESLLSELKDQIVRLSDFYSTNAGASDKLLP